MLSASFGELDSFFLPERRHQLDNLKSMKSMSTMRDDEEAGAPPRPVDLRSGTAVIKVRRAAGLYEPDCPDTRPLTGRSIPPFPRQFD